MQFNRVALEMKLVPPESHEEVFTITATLQRSDGAELPIADQLIHDPTAVQECLALTEGKRVEDGGDETLRNVEVRRSFFTRVRAAGILGEKVLPTVPRMLLVASRDFDQV